MSEAEPNRRGQTTWSKEQTWLVRRDPLIPDVTPLAFVSFRSQKVTGRAALACCRVRSWLFWCHLSVLKDVSLEENAYLTLSMQFILFLLTSFLTSSLSLSFFSYIFFPLLIISFSYLSPLGTNPPSHIIKWKELILTPHLCYLVSDRSIVRVLFSLRSL